MKKLILLVTCDDKPGIVAEITAKIHQNGGNIVDLEQHSMECGSKFFLRINWSANNTDKFFWNSSFADVFEKYDIKANLYHDDEKINIAIFVSKSPHCLYEILSQYQSGRLNVNIAFIASNHEDLKSVAQQFGCQFYHCPINNNKVMQEKRLLELLKQYNVSNVVLARYMQILSAEFIDHYKHKIINIHHSFLPAFVGAKPYHQAFDKGVKIIGSTSHFVTKDLDQGPIICQSVTKVSHKDSASDLVEIGKTLEQQTLIKAIKLFVQHKIIVYKTKTIIFN